MASCGEMSCSKDGPLFRELTEEPQIVKDNEDENAQKCYDEEDEDEDDRPRSRKAKEEADIMLADGMPLPKYLRNDFPDALFGKPISDIDPFYNNKNTFIVVSSNWVIHRFSSLKSLWLLTPLNGLRWFCIRTVTHWTFRIFMILVVMAYTIFWKGMEHLPFHMIFMTIFAVEMNVKIIAHGFLMHPFSYLRNPWNWIDFVLTQFGLSLGFIAHYLHPFHSLRILRLINFFTHSRLSYSWMFRSLCRMKDPLLYGTFLFFLFTIYAQQFFSGHLQNKCATETWVAVKVNRFSNHTINVKRLNILPDKLCGNASGTGTCPSNYTCKNKINWENPDHGYTSFDNFPLAAVSIMRLMSRDLWDKLYTQIHLTVGPWEFPFFLTVIVYGGYYLVNLLFAYIAVGITELLQILEGKKPKRKSYSVTSPEPKSDEVDASSKEKSNVVDENHSVHGVEVVPLVNIDDSSPDIESDTIVQEQVSSDVTRGEKRDDGDVEKSDEYRRRRNPVCSFCLSLVDKFCDWHCCRCWVGFQKKLTVLVSSVYFNVFIGLCIILNTAALASDYHGISRRHIMILDISNVVFGFIYIIEAILKILALSPRHYFKDSLNTFDFFIVIGIIIEMGVYLGFGMSVLRMFRLTRIFRIARWHYFSDLMKICRTNTWALCIVVFMFAWLAEGLFQEHYYHGDLSHSRWNFSSFLNSVVTLFRLICGEWIEPLWECMPQSGGWYCIPYFFSILVVGNLALYTLFATMLAVALNSTNLSETEPVDDRNLISVLKSFLSFNCCSSFCQATRLEAQTVGKSREELFNMSADEVVNSSGGEQLTFGDDVVTPCWCDACYTCLPCCGSPYNGSSAAATANNTSFWITWAGFRRWSLRVIHNKWFEYGMTTFIILSCVTQAWASATYGFFYVTFVTMNYLVAIVYGLEICLQISGLGCKTYFTNGWYLFDFIITVLHIISMVATLFGVFLVPLGFRPLKLIRCIKRLQVVIGATLNKLSSLLDVLLSCSILWLFFAIMGVQLFMGSFYSCVNEQGVRVIEIVNKSHCLSSGTNGTLYWLRDDYQFDDVVSAFLTLIRVASRKGWITVMHSAFDSQGIDRQPVQEASLPASWYFIAFFILGVLACFTLILATFLRKSNDQRQQIIGGYIEILMTEDQRKEFRQKKGNFFITPVKCSPCPEWWPRRFAYRLVFSSQFKLLVILVTSFNAFGLAAITLQTGMIMETAIYRIDLAFHLAFTLEVLLRVAAFGRSFFKRKWNIYDFVVLVGSTVVYTLYPFIPQYLVSPLLFGLFRIVRMVRWLKWVRRIVSRLALYLPALNNVGFLLFVLIFTYAGIASQIYKEHFIHFGLALLRLALMAFSTSSEAFIVNYEELEGSRWFEFSFLAFVYLLLLEAGAVLFLEHYHLLREKSRLGLTDDALESYELSWKILDPDATGYISVDHLSEFLHALLPPLQIAHPNLGEIAALNLPIYKDENVAFNDVLRALLARLDDQGKYVPVEVQIGGDVVSSTLKQEQEAATTSAERELQVV